MKNSIDFNYPKGLHIIAMSIAMVIMSTVNLNAQPGNDKDDLEAKLMYDIEQWLEDAPLSFEEQTKEVIEKGMHKKAEELKTLEAQLEAQIEYLERLEGFITDDKETAVVLNPTVTPAEDLK